MECLPPGIHLTSTESVQVSGPFSYMMVLREIEALALALLIPPPFLVSGGLELSQHLT